MEFAGKIDLVCFASCYLLALAAEAARVAWPARAWRWLGTGAAAAGVFAQSLWLAAHAAQQGRLPISTRLESMVTVSWLLTLAYLYILARDRRASTGLFLLPASLALTGWAALASPAEAAGPLPPRENEVVAVAHGVLLLAGTAIVVVGALASAMYLVKAWQLRGGGDPAYVRLPSLERLERVGTVAVYLAWPMFSAGLLLGLALRQLDWSDPKVWSSAAAWAVFTVLAHYRHQPEHRGRRGALLTIAACAVVLWSVLGDPLTPTSHQRPAPADPAATQAQPAAAAYGGPA